MRKIVLISLALVLALGGLGVGYAAWTDEVTVSGSVTTGEVCLEWVQIGLGDDCPHGPDAGGLWTTGNLDDNLDYLNWNPATPWVIPSIPVDKNVACTDYSIVGVGNDTLLVTIYNGYPLYYVDLQVHLHNCGTVPLKIQGFQITPVNFTMADAAWMPNNGGPVWVRITENTGVQLEPCDVTAASLEIVIQQSAEQNAGLAGGPPAYQFLVTYTAVQWDEMR